MTDDKHDEDALPTDETVDWRELELLAMRTIAGLQPVCETCNQRACQRTGLCHMVIDAEGVAHCGAGFDADLMAHACEAILDFILHSTRVFRVGQPWSRYDRSLGQSARHGKRPHERRRLAKQGGRSRARPGN